MINCEGYGKEIFFSMGDLACKLYVLALHSPTQS